MDFAHWIGLIISVGGFVWMFMQHKAELSKWRGIIETKVDQIEKDCKILHGRIDDKESDTKESIEKLTKEVSDLKNCMIRMETKFDTFKKD